MRTGSVSYGPGRRRLPWLLRAYGRLRWPVRIAAWIVTAGLAGLAGWQYAPLGPLAFEVAFVVYLLASHRIRRYRQQRLSESAVPRPERLSQAEALLPEEARRQAALPRVPSPGGWTAPADVRPAWNWTPPPGITPRMDRVPPWVRLWYGTPFADRSAHAWMWYHGGWDVVPPGAWSSPPSS